MRRLAWFVAVSLATLTVVLALFELRGAALLFVLSLIAAATVRPLSQPLTERGLSPGWSLILIYAAIFLLLGLLAYAIGPALLSEGQQLANDLALAYDRITIRWPQGDSFQQTIAERLPPSSDLYETVTGSQGVLVVQALLGATAGLFGVISQVVIVLVLSIYWGAGRTRFERLWLSLLPAEQRVRARNIWRSIETDIGAYIRSELVQSAIAAVVLGLGYWGWGLPYPLVLALIGALARLVPIVGGGLAVIPAVMVGLTVSAPLAIIAAFYTLAIFIILERIVEPYFFNRRRYSSLLLVLLMTLLANDFSLLGLMMAPPLAVAVQAIFGNLVRQAVPVTTKPIPEIVQLNEQLANVRASLSKLEKEPPPGTVNMIERLETLIEEASQVLAARSVEDDLGEASFSASPSSVEPEKNSPPRSASV